MSKRTVQTLTQRKDWLDVLRALAMLFVIFGHFYRESATYFIFTSPIKIPLFFAVSGYLFHDSNGDMKAFFARLFKRLVIPWLVLSVTSVVIYLPFRGWGYLGNAIANILIGENVWYMPCCIIAEILFMFSKRFTKNMYQLSAASVILTASGYILSVYGLLEICKINTALICQSFLLLGHLIRKHEHKLQELKLWVPLGGVAGYMLLAIVSMLLFPGKALDVNNNIYYNIPMCIALITLGCITLFALAPKIKWYPRSLVFIGQNTLVLYIFHPIGRAIVELVLQKLQITLPDTWYTALGMTAVVCVGCGLGAALLNWLLPEAVGKKRIKNVTV